MSYRLPLHTVRMLPENLSSFQEKSAKLNLLFPSFEVSIIEQLWCNSRSFSSLAHLSTPVQLSYTYLTGNYNVY